MKNKEYKIENKEKETIHRIVEEESLEKKYINHIESRTDYSQLTQKIKDNLFYYISVIYRIFTAL